jgi:hypothetical protein
LETGRNYVPEARPRRKGRAAYLEGLSFRAADREERRAERDAKKNGADQAKTAREEPQELQKHPSRKMAPPMGFEPMSRP